MKDYIEVNKTNNLVGVFKYRAEKCEEEKNKMRKLKQDKEHIGCTFHPNSSVNSSKKKEYSIIYTKLNIFFN